MGLQLTPAVYRNPRYERRLAKLEQAWGELVESDRQLAAGHLSLFSQMEALAAFIQAQQEQLPGEQVESRHQRPH